LDYATKVEKFDERVTLNDDDDNTTKADTKSPAIFIDSKAQLTLLGSEMDYVQTKLASEFVFNNPNIKGTCGCGESFNI
jgi:iron-sulfur cluster assembly accessory protein